MKTLLVVYYARPGSMRATARAIATAARSAGAEVHLRPMTRTIAASFFRNHASAPRWLKEVVGGAAGLDTVVVCGPLRAGISHSAVAILRNSGRSSRVPRAQSSMPLRLKELLSAALANSQACENWLSKPTLDLGQARRSIVKVTRDVTAIAQMIQ
jgi:hypothetical protein